MPKACYKPNCKPVNTLMTHIPFTTLPKLTLPSPGCEVQGFTHTHTCVGSLQKVPTSSLVPVYSENSTQQVSLNTTAALKLTEHQDTNKLVQGILQPDTDHNILLDAAAQHKSHFSKVKMSLPHAADFQILQSSSTSWGLTSSIIHNTLTLNNTNIKPNAYWFFKMD